MADNIKTLEKMKNTMLSELKKDLKSLSLFSNKPNMNYDQICKISQRIYNNCEALKRIK